VSAYENLPSVNVVVVGVDASETALTAALEAASLAHRLGASLHIVSAVTSDAPVRAGTGSNEFTVTGITRAEQTLADVASRLGGDLVVTVAAARGKPADVIVAQAEAVGADLIVVGSRRMTGIGRVLGSIANDVAHHAPCSVYIAKTTN
jgi:nucleotide-binding universal stress UspA family protein